MKFACFIKDGMESYGEIVGDQVLDYGFEFRDSSPSLKEFISSENRKYSSNSNFKKYKLDEVEFLIPMSDTSKILCIGLNYKAHAEEGKFKIPQFPQVFSRFRSSVAAHRKQLMLPKISSNYDFEGELAVVIGKPARHVSEESALEYVFGYTCFNDGSIRDIQFDHSLIAGKNFPSTGAMGPYIVTTDEVPDPAQLNLTTRLNGQVVQSKGLDDLIFDVPQIISYLSTIMLLEPGDVIATGTPEGVGYARTPPLWMKSGDIVEVEITKIGALVNHVEAEKYVDI